MNFNPSQAAPKNSDLETFVCPNYHPVMNFNGLNLLPICNVRVMSGRIDVVRVTCMPRQTLSESCG